MQRNHSHGVNLVVDVLQVVLRQEPRLACGVAHEDASFLGRLDVGLEVATDSVADRGEGELGSVKEVAVVRGKLEQSLGELVVVLLLLDGVVKGRVTEVLFPVGDEELFELGKDVSTRSPSCVWDR